MFNGQMFKSSNVYMFKISNVQMLRVQCSNVQIFKSRSKLVCNKS